MKKAINNIIFFIFISVVLISCSQRTKSDAEAGLVKKTEDSLKLKLNIKEYREIKLNKQADTIVRKWAMYVDLKNEVKRLENYTLLDVISNISTLEKAVDSLQKTIPSAVDTFPVTSRINVLNTKAKYMLLLSEKQKPRLSEIKVIAEEYPLEFNALNTQLNEIFVELPNFEN